MKFLTITHWVGPTPQWVLFFRRQHGLVMEEVGPTQEVLCPFPRANLPGMEVHVHGT